MSVLEALLGRRNISAVQPGEFGNRFQRGHLKGKLANIITEIKQGAKIDDAAVKVIVSGEVDTVEGKWIHPFDFRPHATCWFGTDRDPFLIDKLLAEGPSILNLALDPVLK